MNPLVIIGIVVILFILAVILIKNIIGFVLFRLIPLAVIGGAVWYFVIHKGVL
mgnify:CR=1 FL=1